jgi:O-antigen ligase
MALFLGPETIVVQRVKLDISRGESISLTSRMERWAHSVEIILRNPLIGVGFSPELGGEGATSKVFRSHNQYLDLWFKAGILPLLVFLILAGQALGVLLYRHNRASTQFEHGVTLGVLVGWIVVLGVSNLQQNNFAQPYTGNMLWFTLGLVEGYFAHRSLITQMPNRLPGPRMCSR